MKRRTAAWLLVLAFMLSVLAGCGKQSGPGGDPSDAANTPPPADTTGTSGDAGQSGDNEWYEGCNIEINMISYAGSSQEPHKFYVADVMEQKYPGLKIRLVPSESQDCLAQIKASLSSPPYDLMPNGEPPHLQMIADSLIQKTTAEDVPNLADIDPSFIEKSQGYGVPVTYQLIGIAYNEDLVMELAGKVPTDWSDLWDPAYAGMVGLVAPSSNLGLGFLVNTAKQNGGTEADLTAGFEKIAELSDPVIASSPTALAELLEREEIALCPLWATDTAVLADKGMNIGFVKPSSGAICIVSCVSIINNTKYPALCKEILNILCSEEYQEKAAAAPYYFGPTNKNVEVPADAAAYIPSSPEEVQALSTIDWPVIVPNRAGILDTWNQMFTA